MNRFARLVAAVFVAAVLLSAAVAAELLTRHPLDSQPTLPAGLGLLGPIPDNPANPATTSKIELGRRLFFDPRFSDDGKRSCATCHLPEKAFADGLRFSIGPGGVPRPRNTPSLLNIGYARIVNWDGKSASLEEQAAHSFASPAILGLANDEEFTAIAEDDPAYVELFDRVFGARPTVGHAGAAIAAYERTLVSRDSRFDRYVRGDKKALSAEEKRGLALFVGKAECARCHGGPYFSDGRFHAIGVRGDDPGRFKVTSAEADRGVFKTPTLRDIALTAPYMHDGSLATLMDVVDFYDRGGDGGEGSESLATLGLSEREKGDLVAFMQSLTGTTPDAP